MPGRYYMGVDYRPDHSFRIPDPALDAAIGSPDACLRCHVDQDSQWSQQAVTEWYGPGRKDHYGYLLAGGRIADPAAEDGLRQLAADVLYPVIVRATALSLLAGYPGPQTQQAMEIALVDEEALIRHTAAASIQAETPEMLAKLLGPVLYDPVRTVRIEAARRLAGDASQLLDTDQQALFSTVLQEYEDAMLYTGDFAASRHNLANLYAELDRPQDAITQYRQAIRIDNRFYPAKVNLALLHNRLGQNDLAEQLLKEVVSAEPDQYELAYTLGLLLAEMQKYLEAASYLERASQGLPERARIHYNLGLLYQYLQNLTQAESELRTALDLEPQNLDFQYGLADHYLKLGRFEDARPIVEDMVILHPENPIGNQMMEFIRQNTGR
jgi:tetratricopeptide (TPR) repeat protein